MLSSKPLRLATAATAGLAVIGAAVATLIWSRGDGEVTLSKEAQAGEVAFNQNCAVCHGEQGMGTTQGPPLVHEIYEPSHHGDASFVRAVTQGVVPHHWDYGPMPPVPQVGPRSVQQIITYVRELQRAEGIE